MTGYTDTFTIIHRQRSSWPCQSRKMKIDCAAIS
jgi:hypothetical protein